MLLLAITTTDMYKLINYIIQYCWYHNHRTHLFHSRIRVRFVKTKLDQNVLFIVAYNGHTTLNFLLQSEATTLFVGLSLTMTSLAAAPCELEYERFITCVRLRRRVELELCEDVREVRRIGVETQHVGAASLHDAQTALPEPFALRH